MTVFLSPKEVFPLSRHFWSRGFHCEFTVTNIFLSKRLALLRQKHMLYVSLWCVLMGNFWQLWLQNRKYLSLDLGGTWQKRIFFLCRFSWVSIFFLFPFHCAEILQGTLCHRRLGCAREPLVPVLVSPDLLSWDCEQFWGRGLSSSTCQLVLVRTGLNCPSTLLLRTSRSWCLLSGLLHGLARKVRLKYVTCGWMG